MALYDVYEREGAVFRAPAGHRWITEVRGSDGGWRPYRGADRLKPIHFGDYLGRREMADLVSPREDQPDARAASQEGAAAAQETCEGESPQVLGDDYSEEIRAEIGATLSVTTEGEWAELALCPSPYGCPYEHLEAALAAGVEEHFCPDCKVIRLYRPEAPSQP